MILPNKASWTSVMALQIKNGPIELSSRPDRLLFKTFAQLPLQAKVKADIAFTI
jgi:hypothetical protein